MAIIAVLCSSLVRKRSATGADYESLFPPQRSQHPYPGDGMPLNSLSPSLCFGVDLGDCYCNITCKDESLSVLLECETYNKTSNLEWILENSYRYNTSESSNVDSITKLSAEYGIGACVVNETDVAAAKNQDRRMLKTQPALRSICRLQELYWLPYQMRAYRYIPTKD